MHWPRGQKVKVTWLRKPSVSYCYSHVLLLPAWVCMSVTAYVFYSFVGVKYVWRTWNYSCVVHTDFPSRDTLGEENRRYWRKFYSFVSQPVQVRASSMHRYFIIGRHMSSQSLDRFRCLCAADLCAQDTDHTMCDICSNRPHLCTAV